MRAPTHVHDAVLGARVGARDVGAADGAGVGSGVGSGLGTKSNETYEYDHLAAVTSGAAAATIHSENEPVDQFGSQSLRL